MQLLLVFLLATAVAGAPTRPKMRDFPSVAAATASAKQIQQIVSARWPATAPGSGYPCRRPPRRGA